MQNRGNRNAVRLPTEMSQMTVTLDHMVGEELAPPLRAWSGMSKYVITGGCHI